MIDRRAGALAHAGGAHGVENRGADLARRVHQLRLRAVVRAGADFLGPVSGQRRLRDDSPFLNLGLGTIPIYGFLGYDLGGSLRTRFGALDPGAWENQTWDIIFANGFQ